ncbi:hypothetical protein [uncultured Cyclobacterium sp.]|uniref:hypothetical protein n=1 Tax=uncultured Cyclobacterium sp. TaxID=453820 RepID=UPI0030EB313F|tara:strand:- start:16248 stop:17213 length:966 start_codon:yes stop_codon:yes gene_type:complete
MNLKLAIYTIDVKHKHKKDKVNFENAFKTISVNTLTKEEYYKDFITKYIQSFDGKFTSSDENSKSITTDNLEFIVSENLIYGMIKGGTTNVEIDIFESKNSGTPVGKISRNQIAAQPYFFLLYTPYDKSYGVLMIQYYSIASVTTSFKKNLHDFFRKHELTLSMYPFVTEKQKKSFLKKSVINKISLSKVVRDNAVRSKFNPLIIEEDSYEVVIEFRKIKQNPEKIIERIKDSVLNNKKIIGADLSDFGIQDNSNLNLKVFYENEDGKKSHSSMKNDFEILPTIDLPDSLKEKLKDSPNLLRTKEHCFELLKTVKEEILKK